MNEQPINQATATSGAAGKVKKSVNAPRKGRGARGVLNFILFIAIIIVVALFVRAEMERRSTAQELEQTASELRQLRETAERSGQAVADEVLIKLRRHMVLPEDPAPTVATIVDIEQLRASNDFYTPAENGDHLIITENRAILYDSDRDLILDIVPVQINQAQAEEALGDEGEEGGDLTSPSLSPLVSGSPSPTAIPAFGQ